MTTNIGCCGRRTNLEGFVAQADLHPVTTPAGRRARAAIAMAIVERAALSRGDGALAARARRGLQGLGTTDTIRAAGVQAALRSLRSTGAEQALAGNTAARQLLDQVLTIASAVIGIAESAVAAAAANEAANAAREGRPVDNTVADVGKVTSWLRWAFGGPFPSTAAESDLRIFATVWAIAEPIISGLIPTAATALRVPPATTTAVQAYLARLGASVRAAVAALPPPLTPPPPVPSPDEVAAAVGRHTALSPASISNLRRNVLYVSDQARRIVPSKTGTSPILVALPAAAVLWYLFK